jgi:Ni/Fe-hydrogenase subunit HybB-like protein
MTGFLAFALAKLTSPVGMALCFFMIFRTSLGPLPIRVLYAVAAATVAAAIILSALSVTRTFGELLFPGFIGAWIQTGAALLAFALYRSLKNEKAPAKIDR